MSSAAEPGRRTRRRVVRPSPAENIDRSVDLPDDTFQASIDSDAEREVILDPDAEETPGDAEFWREQRPPHHS